MSGVPASFGRRPPPEVVEKPEPDKPKSVEIAGGLRVVDGRLVVDVDARVAVPDEVLQGLYDQIRDVVALAVADGFAAATGRPQQDVDELLPPGAGEEPEGGVPG